MADQTLLGDRASLYAPGVTDRHGHLTGSATALIAAGVVQAQHLPGMPGMRKVRVTVLADGTVLEGPTTANTWHHMAPGAKVISRRGRDSFEVFEWKKRGPVAAPLTTHRLRLVSSRGPFGGAAPGTAVSRPALRPVQP